MKHKVIIEKSEKYQNILKSVIWAKFKKVDLMRSHWY